MSDFLNTRYVAISVMGPHAGESEDEIFGRKINDTKKVDKTFWLMRSHQAKPHMVQRLCNEAKIKNEDIFTVFVESSSTGGATPTTTVDYATSYSKDSVRWKNLPKGLSPVTGKIDSGAYALVFGHLELVNGTINLWDYANFFNQEQPLRIFQGASTLCAIRKDMSNHPNRIKSNCRKIIAIGKFCEPFCVWLK